MQVTSQVCLRIGSGKTLVCENHLQVENCWIVFIQCLTLQLANRALFSNNLLISILFALALQKLSPFVPAFIFRLSESSEIKKKSITQLVTSEGGSVFLAARLAYGEGNGTPLQYSCLENPMDEGA